MSQPAQAVDQTPVPLHTLPPGTKFQIGKDDNYGRAKQGTLIHATECRARVCYSNVPAAEAYAIDIAARTMVTVLPEPATI